MTTPNHADDRVGDRIDHRFELVVLPVADPDRSKQFYEDVMGWHVDVDHAPGPEFRVVQVTPPGSACSISFGIGLADGRPEPGSYRGLHLVVTDVVAARDELVERGADVGPVRHHDGSGWAEGPHPDRMDFGTYADLADPDGNTWVLQERGHPDAAAGTPRAD